MKKLTSLAAGLLLYAFSQAQGPELGVLAGLNLAKAVFLEKSYNLKSKYGAGFRIGGYARWEVRECFCATPARIPDLQANRVGPLFQFPRNSVQ